MIDRLRIGQRAERKAEKHLQRQGLKIVLRNFRCRGGELDLIAEHGEHIVIIEVRERSHTTYGSAAESVDHHKQQKLIHAARVLLQENPAWEDRPIRFDVVGIDGRQVTWIQDAFEA